MTANNRGFSLAALTLAGAALFVPMRAGATLSHTATFDEKVENAAAIVLGRVIKTESKFDPSRRWILTYTTFKVEQTFKGATGGEVTLVTPGGRVGEIYQDTIGVPEFQAGQEHVLFVKNSAAGPTVLYFEQGAYDIARDDKGERVIAPVASDAVRIDSQRGMAVAEEAPRSLRQFESDVRTSQRRAAFNRMEMIRKQQEKREQSTVWTTVARYKYLFAAAFIGLVLATIHLIRR